VSTPPIVPFVRVIHEGDAGSHIAFTKRALSRAGYIEWPDRGYFTQVAGEFWVQSLNRFKKAKSLKQNGVYDFPTHEALRKSHRRSSRTEWAFDHFAIAGLTGLDITPHERAVQRTLDAVDYAILKRDLIVYAQTRPMPDRQPFPNIPNIADCSGFVTWAARSGGWIQDPNYPVGSSRKWDGYGFTGSLWANGDPVPGLLSARLCDLVFYGTPWMAGGAAHVGIVRAIENGVVYIGHHGQTAGPFNSRADYRKVTGLRRYRLV
jgi:hypothetical protein